MKRMKTMSNGIWTGWMKGALRLKAEFGQSGFPKKRKPLCPSARWEPSPGFRSRWISTAVVAAATLTAALALSACVSVANNPQVSLVRAIDASYNAPAINVVVEGALVAANTGQGTITTYGTVSPNEAALIQITATTAGTALVTTNGDLLSGDQYSVFLTDNSASSSGYKVTILEDQKIAAASGHSAFRFLNQAPKTGAVDVYMVPAGTDLADATPIVTDLPAGSATSYISFVSQTVTMVVTPTGKTTPSYAYTSMALTGGEVRTVLLMDSQLTSYPAVVFTVADDAGPSD